jgi:hypothetical protein
MPTKFGNILKASEAYAATRYGLDYVAFWPLLLGVIPSEYKKTIDGTRNELAFAVNMSLLSVIFYLFCIAAILLTSTLQAGSSSTNLVALIKSDLRYIVAGMISLYAVIFFNQAALYSVTAYGMMIRSAFTLYKLDLLEQFRLKQPKNSIEEYEIWRNLGELLVLGQESLDFKSLEYDIKKPNS